MLSTTCRYVSLDDCTCADLYSLYQLPDGSKWAEHGYFYDADDLEEHVSHENATRPPDRKVDHRSLLLKVRAQP